MSPEQTMSAQWHRVTWNGESYDAELIDPSHAEEILSEHPEGVINDGTEHPDRIIKFNPDDLMKLKRVSFEDIPDLRSKDQIHD